MNRFQKLISECYYPNMELNVEYTQSSDTDTYTLHVTFVDPDTGEPQSGRRWLLEEEMTDSEVVLTAFKAVLTAEEHETRERFRYRNVKIFNPHIDVDAMVDVAKKRDNLDIRNFGEQWTAKAGPNDPANRIVAKA